MPEETVVEVQPIKTETKQVKNIQTALNEKGFTCNVDGTL